MSSLKVHFPIQRLIHNRVMQGSQTWEIFCEKGPKVFSLFVGPPARSLPVGELYGLHEPREDCRDVRGACMSSSQEYAGPPAANRCKCDLKTMFQMRVYATWYDTFELNAKVISQESAFPDSLQVLPPSASLATIRQKGKEL